MDDLKIIDLFNLRSEDAISKTREKYGTYINSIIYGLLRSFHDTEEIANDTYLGLWQSIPPARPKDLKAYIAAIARKKAMDKLDYFTAQKRNTNLTVLIDELEEVLPGRDSPEDTISTKETLNEINIFLSGLTVRDRYVFLRRYWFGDTVKEIAEKSGCSEATVKNTLFKTRKKLKCYLEKAGVKL